MMNRSKTPAAWAKQHGLRTARLVPLLTEAEIRKACRIHCAWAKMNLEIMKSRGKS